ncbi:hypothetical protein BJ742DRAFT_793799 [Cladochytrium replicatum]|nr:hypothetical protein BJ742DRAFT_793799 [Cladochytrium replicatum]
MIQAFREVHKEGIIRLPESKYSGLDTTQLEKYHGRVAYATADTATPSVLLKDGDFDLSFDGALKIRRNAEYCQWVESYEEKENEDGERYRTYYYYKTWQSYPVNSLFFDQPGAHHNPQYDPFPTSESCAPSAVIKTAQGDLKYDVDQKVLNSLRGWEPVVQYTRNDFQRMEESVAGQAGFKPIGNGYFYRPHKASSAETFLKMAAQVLEGSILDYQIGDLFSACNAGDLRIRYEAIVPTQGLSIIGGFSKYPLTSDTHGTLTAHKTSNGFTVALIQHGSRRSPELMFAVEQRRQLMWLFAARAALFVWAFVVASSKVSRIEWTNPYHWIAFSIAGWAACVSGLSFATWGRTLMLFVFAGSLGVGGVAWQMNAADRTKLHQN